MEKVTSKRGKGLSLEYTNISFPTDLDTIYALKFTTVRGFLSCFSSKGHWASLEFTTTHCIRIRFRHFFWTLPTNNNGRVKLHDEDLCSRPYFGTPIQTDFRPAPRT